MYKWGLYALVAAASFTWVHSDSVRAGGAQSEPDVKATRESEADAKENDQDQVRRRRSSRSRSVVNQPTDYEIDVIFLEHAYCQNVAEVVGKMEFALGSNTLTSIEQNQNALIVGASAETLVKVRDLVKQLDHPVAQGRSPSFVDTPVKLANASAKDVADYLLVLSKSFGNRRAAAGVICDSRTNTVWLSGNKEQVDRLAKVASQMDAPTESGPVSAQAKAPVTRIYALNHCRPSDAAKTLHYLQEAAGGKARFFPFDPTRRLFVLADDNEQEIVSGLVSELDIPVEIDELK
jgi:type II secretory pathway component GspD/PulD (secretin)